MYEKRVEESMAKLRTHQKIAENVSNKLVEAKEKQRATKVESKHEGRRTAILLSLQDSWEDAIRLKKENAGRTKGKEGVGC